MNCTVFHCARQRPLIFHSVSSLKGFNTKTALEIYLCQSVYCICLENSKMYSWRQVGFFVTQLAPDWTLCSSFNICHPHSLSILSQKGSCKFYRRAFEIPQVKVLFCLLLLWTVEKGWGWGLMDMNLLHCSHLLWKIYKEIWQLWPWKVCLAYWYC